MDPYNLGANPYSLPSIRPIESGNSLSGWLFQPYQQNSSGTLPGTTVINVGQVISIDGHNDYITVSTSAGIRQIVMGLLPDGSYGMVVSKPGIDVLTVFS